MRYVKTEIKPLSVNQAWRGQRYKSNAYNKFIRDVTYVLPSQVNVPKDKIKLDIEFGFSNMGSDIDNPLKMFIDCLSKKYGFNDNRIMKLEVTKAKAKVGKEYIKWRLSKP